MEPALAANARSYISANEQKLQSLTRTGFSTGEKVRHKVFGQGEILEVKKEEGCYAIKFEKLKTVRSVSVTASLERI